MNKQIETRRLVAHRAGINVGRRSLLKLTGLGVVTLSMMSVADPAVAQSTLAWDKTFRKSERVDHRKVSFYNRLGITLVADLYIPKNIDRSRRHAALVVGGPYGAVKEQASGLYAQTMAERGFITIALIHPTWARAAASRTASPHRKPSWRTSAPRKTFWVGCPLLTVNESD